MSDVNENYMVDGLLVEKSDNSFMEQEIGVNITLYDFRILVKSVTFPEKTKSGLIVSEVFRNMEARSHNVGLILGMGPLAYTQNHPGEKFCTTPRNIGDWIYYSSYEREAVNINGHMCYFLNDERVYGKIPEKDLIKIIPELERYK